MKTLLVIALLLPLSTIVHASDVPALQCAGTEPFWGVTTDQKGFLSFSDPASEDGGKKFYSKTTVQNAAGVVEGYAFQITATDMKNNTLKLDVVKDDCNDGMSDEVYSYNALVEVNGSLFVGCCR